MGGKKTKKNTTVEEGKYQQRVEVEFETMSEFKLRKTQSLFVTSVSRFD